MNWKQHLVDDADALNKLQLSYKLLLLPAIGSLANIVQLDEIEVKIHSSLGNLFVCLFAA